MNFITDKDIIGGQGKGADLHPGNVMFRKLVNAHKETYARAPNSDKQKISRGIVAALRRCGFNFLKFDADTGCFDDIGDKKAAAKTSQALREKRNNKGDSNFSSSCITSSNTSSEESCVNFSIGLLQSLSKEEPASPSQQEKYGAPRRPTHISNLSVSDDRALLAIFKEEVAVSDRELSAQFREISEMVVNNLKEEPASPSPTQQEPQEKHDVDMPRLPRPTLLPNRSITDNSFLQILHLSHDSFLLSNLEREMSEMTFGFEPTPFCEQATEIPNAAITDTTRYGFEFSMPGMDRLSLDDNGKVEAV
ncbi:hypothetical protein ACHAXM_009951 [Skeletonema potamos]|jgi:hypothetical protein